MPVQRNNDSILKEVLNIFSAHLESSGQRKTPERFAILEEIYQRSDHFDAEGLYIHSVSDDSIRSIPRNGDVV